MQILKLFQWFQPITDDHTRHRDDVINDVVHYDSNCEYGEQRLQISHAYFCFVSAFCFTCKHAETKLKQNNFTGTKHCFTFVLFQFYFRRNHCITLFSLYTHNYMYFLCSDAGRSVHVHVAVV